MLARFKSSLESILKQARLKKMCVYGQSLNIVIKRIIFGHKILKMELLR